MRYWQQDRRPHIAGFYGRAIKLGHLEIKMSLIMDERDEFENAKRRFEGITIPDDISVILVDMTDDIIGKASNSAAGLRT